MMITCVCGFKCSFVALLFMQFYPSLSVSSATGDASKAPTISSQKERQTVFPKSNLPIPEDVPEEIKDPCQTAEILEQPWRHWTYDDSEVPLKNGKRKYECDAYLLPLRRWFGFSVNGIRSEIIYGHVKSHRCGTLHPLSLSFDNSLLFQQSMLYPQLKSFQNVEERSGDDEYEDEHHEVNFDEDEEYLNRRRYLDFQGEMNKNRDVSSVTSPSPSSSSQLSSIMLNELHFSTQSQEGLTRHPFLNNSEEPFHSFFDSSSLLNSTDQNSVLNEAYDFHSTFTRKTLSSQTFSLPKYERIYDSIFESHSRRLYSYMLRDFDTIQELQQFLLQQQLLMNSSIISNELREDQILLGNIHALNSLFHSGAGELAKLNNDTKFSFNFSTINVSACYSVMKKLEQSIEQKKKKINVLLEERERITKLKKAKLHLKKKNQRLSFLRQNYTVAQLCVYHRFLDESSCVDALSVPIVIKKCPSGAVYWLEKITQQCPSGACVKKINETASYEVFLNIPKEELMLKPLSQLLDHDLKSLVSIEFNISTNHADFKNFCSSLRPILAKKLKHTISTKSRSPRKFLKVKGKPTERNYTRLYKEEKFDGALIPDLDPDAAGPRSNNRRKNKLKRNAKAFDGKLFSNMGIKTDLETCDGIDSILKRSSPQDLPPTTTPTIIWETRPSKELDEECTNEDLELIKFVEYEPIVLDGKLRISIFVDGNTTLVQGDVLDAVKSLNASGELDAENMTLTLIYPGFPGDISQMRSGGRAAKFWQENKDMLLCAFVILGILSLFVVMYVLCRLHKMRKKKEQLLGGKRYHKFSQTDHLITGYIFGTSTPIVFFKSSTPDDYEDLVNEVYIED